MARPTELTPELADQVAKFIRVGNWPEAAAVAAGVSARTFYRWMARGRDADELHEADGAVDEVDEPFWQFWQQVKRAEAESEALAVAQLTKAMPSTPTATIAWLERRFRERWSRTERLEHAGDGGGPVLIVDAKAKLAAKVEAIAKRLRESGAVEGDDP